MKLLLPFQKISKTDASIAGGKGASLGEMTQAGIPVPTGFVILASAFERFIQEANIAADIDAILHSVKHEEVHTVENASEKIKAIILSASMPKDIASEISSNFKKLNSKFVAVRSSATAEDSSSAAWAGQLDSFLNTTESTLLENVKKCWASLFTPRAIFYRFEKNLHDQSISVAVVVQKMVESEASGIAFSVHPVTEDYNQMIIEAGFGLGEAIVSGQVTPDSYVVEKNSMTIIESNTAKQEKALYRKDSGGNEWRELTEEKKSQQKLSGKQIIELSTLIIKIENHYGFPVDVEWAIEKEKFYIVQSRPITTLSKKTETTKKLVNEKFVFNWSESESALTTELWANELAKLGSEIGGVNYALLFFVEKRQAYGFTSQTWIELAGEYSKKHFLRPGFRSEFLSKSAFARKAFDDFYEEVLKKDLKKASNEELLKLLDKYSELYKNVTRWFDFSQAEFIDPPHEFLKKQLEKYFTAGEIPKVVAVVLTPTELDIVKREEIALIRLALANYTQDELYVHSIKYSILYYNSYDKRANLLFLENRINELKKLGVSKLKGKIEEIKTNLIELKHNQDKLLEKIKDNEIKELAMLLRDIGIDRFELKNSWAGAEYRFIALFEEIALRIQANLKEFFDCYTLEDTRNGLINNFKLSKEEIEEKREAYAFLLENNVLTYFFGNKAKILAENLVSDYFAQKFESLNGTIANPGIARGRARIVKVVGIDELVNDLKDFQQGEILITTMTQPNMVLLIQKAAAIVTDQGGITSHAAVLSREFKIPCIVGTHSATKVLKTGDFVEVDANNGIVRIIENGNSSNFNSENFSLAFKAKGLSFLLASIIENMYKPNNFVYVSSHGEFFQYFSNESVIELGKIGLELYSSKEKFSNYVKTLKQARLESKELTEKILAKEKLSKSDIEMFFKKCLIVEGYTKMDTCYTDEAFKVSNENTIVKENLAVITKLKDEMRDYINQLFFVENNSLEQVLKKLCKEFPLKYEDILNYSTNEVLELFKGKKVDESILNERNKAYAIISKYGNNTYLHGIDAEKLCKQLKQKPENKNEINGVVANKGSGNVSSKVKIINTDYSDFKELARKMEKMNQGDILVSETTAPELMPACKKASAIITDLGGMLSHAAIVSRELGIPCIVDTKFATKALRDGDFIEVDAYNGKVIKISATEKHLSKDNFVRLFNAKNMPYIISDIQANYYKKFKSLSVSLKDEWMIFIPQTVFEETLEEGFKLLENDQKFSDYIQEFEDFKTNADNKMQNILKNQPILKEDAADFLLVASESFKHYSKTEFFYTDKAAQQKDKNLIKNCNKMGEVKNYGRMFMNNVFLEKRSLLNQFLRKIGQQFGMSQSELLQYSVQEIIELFENKKVNAEKIKDRTVAYLINCGKEPIERMQGEQALKVAEEFLKLPNNLTEIKGTIANKGIAKGKAIIIDNVDYKNFDSFSKIIEQMEKGSILVAETTSPELIAACKKASAIVTNQGGLISHASIISRELGIPCIVGTGFATKLIKNGNLIEVDANTGIVKIITADNAGRFVFHWSESQSALNAESWAKAYEKLGDYLDSKNFEAFIVVKKRHTHAFISQSLVQLSDSYSRKQFLKPGFGKEFLSKTSDARKRFDRFYGALLEKDLGKATNEELSQLLAKYFDYYTSIGVYFLFSQAEFTSAPYEELKKQLEKYFPKEEIPNVISILLSPTELDIIKREEADLIKLALTNYTQKELEKHSINYSILFYNSYNKPTNLSFLEERVKELKKTGEKKLNQKLEEIDNSVLVQKIKQEKYLNKINDIGTKGLALLLRALGIDRLEMKNSWAGAEYRFLPLLEGIASRIGVNFKDFIDTYTLEDARKALINKTTLSKTEVEQRREVYTFHLENNKITFTSGSNAESAIGTLIPEYFKQKTTENLKGTIANPGVAKGKTRVVKVIGIDELVKDLKEFQHGEILVTTMTQPNMVILAQKASAIVTDEGGITSHAAVLSREFKIPCIVGTHNATKTLKTGDEIEVDANKGIIKILRKSV